ncbi:MarR family winged helix-turn-helix transcriptional regulator [Solicola sp. PLA-1-18]|uniref:MarR family winged helix-turn-helix transcriptional regulator n=1 Tax=Solicola sp. PLA-1-18 TaxID=3380532 RepID=UPI003B7D22FB
MARRMGTNVSDMTAVLFLATRGSAGAAELADHLGMTRASITVLVDRLERDGMVVRERSTVDRRRVSISTTPAARIAALTAWMPAIDQLDDVCRSFGVDERNLALTLLARLTDAMRTVHQ